MVGRSWPPKEQWALIATLLVLILLANLHPPYPQLAPLQHAPTVLLVLAAPFVLKRWPLTTRSVVLVWLFLVLHTLGGRYIYSYVPYDDWIAGVTGSGLSEAFGLARNSYDRFVHLMFGLLLTGVFAEIAQRHGEASMRVSWLLAFALVGLVSALYEIFEWMLTMLAPPGLAAGYNGQQGDVWDPQKDMALAIAGSAVASILFRVKCSLPSRNRSI